MRYNTEKPSERNVETLIFIDSLFLMPVAAIAIVVAILLLVRSKKREGVRPPRASTYRKVALCLILFAVVVFVVIPMIYFAYLIARFGLAFVFSGIKAAG